MPDENACIPQGTYISSTTDTSIGSVSMTFIRNGHIFIHGTNLSGVTIEITDCDLENGTVSGFFKGTLTGLEVFALVRVNEGVFDDVCIE